MSDQQFRDLLRALRTHPEWLEELRVVILTEELLALPTRFTAMEQRQDRMEQRHDRMELRQERMEQRQERMEQRLDRMEQRLARLEGAETERRYRQHGPGYFGTIARRVRLLSRRDRDDLLDVMEDDGTLDAGEVDELRRADGIFTGRRDGQQVYLVLEASLTIDGDDVRRAVERAALLARTGLPTVPVVAGAQVPDDVAAAAARSGVWVVTDGAAVQPAA